MSLVLCLGIVSVVSPLWASLNLTADQCETQLGPPQQEFLEGNKVFRSYALKDSVTTQETYFNGVCAQADTFSMGSSPLTADQIAGFLKMNSEGSRWNPSRVGPQQRVWVREDRKAVARWDGKVLSVMTLSRFDSLYPVAGAPAPGPAKAVAEKKGMEIPKPFITADSGEVPLPAMRVVAWVVMGVGMLIFLIGHLAVFIRSFQESILWFVFMFILQIAVTVLVLTNENYIYLLFIPLSAAPFIFLNWEKVAGSRWLFFVGLLVIGGGYYLYASSPDAPPVPLPKKVIPNGFQMPQVSIPTNLSTHIPSSLPGSSYLKGGKKTDARGPGDDPLLERLKATLQPAGQPAPEPQKAPTSSQEPREGGW
ncbi:MAG: hypothetical protein SFY92_05845 [Verrucomicrobiae bacterium]|nr:hypothetical protein [Verrucomicrobiae bacterium]